MISCSVVAFYFLVLNILPLLIWTVRCRVTCVTQFSRISDRWRRPGGPGVPAGPQGVRSRAGGVQVRPRGPGRARSDVPEGPLPGLGADLPPAGEQQAAAHTATGEI